MHVWLAMQTYRVGRFMTFVICPGAVILFLIRRNAPPYGWFGFLLVCAGSLALLILGRSFLPGSDYRRLKQEIKEEARRRGIDWDKPLSEETPEEQERSEELLKEYEARIHSVQG